MNKKMTQNVSNTSADGEIDILEILLYLKSKQKFLLIFLLTATHGLTCLFNVVANLSTGCVNFLKNLMRVMMHATHTTESIQDALNTFDRSTDVPLQKKFVCNACGCFAGAGYGSYPGYYGFHKNINQ
jgi:hypothetical protein